VIDTGVPDVYIQDTKCGQDKRDGIRLNDAGVYGKGEHDDIFLGSEHHLRNKGRESLSEERIPRQNEVFRNMPFLQRVPRCGSQGYRSGVLPVLL
jgi:hypothetical protein